MLVKLIASLVLVCSLRLWTSASGKHQVRAELETIVIKDNRPDAVILKRGKRKATVKRSKLSIRDIEHVERVYRKILHFRQLIKSD